MKTYTYNWLRYMRRCSGKDTVLAWPYVDVGDEYSHEKSIVGRGGTLARLAHPRWGQFIVTADLARALAFAIQQFAGTTGRRALIIITDGNEGQSTQLASACLEMAKESGVPIYVIVPRESSETSVNGSVASLTHCAFTSTDERG